MELTVSSILRLRSQLTVNTEYLLLFYITVQWCPLQIIAGGFNSKKLLKIPSTISTHTCETPYHFISNVLIYNYTANNTMHRHKRINWVKDSPIL